MERSRGERAYGTPSVTKIIKRGSFAGENFREFRVSVAIRECFLREGALGYRKFAKVLSAKFSFITETRKFSPSKVYAIRYDHKMVHQVSLNDEPRSRSVGQQPWTIGPHLRTTGSRPRTARTVQVPRSEAGPRLVRVVANDHYKYVRQARERYRMPMMFISILLACLPFNAHTFSARIQSIVRNRGGWNIMRGAAPRIRALGRTL